MTRPMDICVGWLIDGTGGPIRRNVLLRIEQGVIIALENLPYKKLCPPNTVDLSLCTLLPGLIDCHVHLCMSGTTDIKVRREQLKRDFDQVKDVISGHLGEHMSHGIVALRDGGDNAGHTLRFKNECLSDDHHSVRIKSAGRAWHAVGRYGRLIGRPPLDGYSLAQSIALHEERVDHLKIVNSGLNSLTSFGKETAPQFSFEELRAAIQVGMRLGLRTMVHANGRAPVSYAIDAGCHSIEHGYFMGRETLSSMTEHGIFWVPTAYTMKAYAEQHQEGSIRSEIARRNLDHQLEQMTYSRQVGVQIAVGTDSGSLGVRHGRAFLEELKLLMDAGFTLQAALQCASLNGARLIGMEDEFGQLRRGMPATFVVVRGNPQRLPEALSCPESVYVRGKSIFSTKCENQ
ncbi:MAG: amidohydrolase family protein [Dissulfurispiraceae bacterium]